MQIPINGRNDITSKGLAITGADSGIGTGTANVLRASNRVVATAENLVDLLVFALPATAKNGTALIGQDAQLVQS